jgi:hypothetical protein
MNPIAPNEFEVGDLGTVVFEGVGNNHFSDLILYSQRARGIRFQKIQ